MEFAVGGGGGGGRADIMETLSKFQQYRKARWSLEHAAFLVGNASRTYCHYYTTYYAVHRYRSDDCDTDTAQSNNTDCIHAQQ